MNHPGFELVAWIGEDELGSGVVGLKQALCPAGMVPLAAIIPHLDRLSAQYVLDQLQAQVNESRKPVTLIRLKIAEELITLRPQ